MAIFARLRRAKGKQNQKPKSPMSYPRPKVPPDEVHKTPQDLLGIDVMHARRPDLQDALLIRRASSVLVKPGQRYEEKLEGMPPNPASAKSEEERKQLLRARAEWERQRRQLARLRWTTPVYYDKPVELSSILLTWGDKYLDNELFFLVRSVPRSLRKVLAHYEEVKKLGNEAYGRFIDALRNEFLPTQDPSFDYGYMFGRDLIVWGATDAMLDVGLFSKFQGRVPTVYEAGSFQHSVINRLPIAFDELRVDPLKAAAPTVKEELDFLLVNDQRQYFWHGRVLPRFLPAILAIANADIYVHAQVQGLLGDRQLYYTCLIRSSEYPPRNQEESWFRFIDKRLRYLGPWSRVRGDDALWRAFLAFVPGSPPMHMLDPLRKWRSSALPEPEPVDFLDSFAETVDGAKPIKGSSFLGKKIGPGIQEPESYEAKERPSVAVIGQSGTGKTTFAMAVAGLQETPYVMVVQLTTARQEGAMTWARAFGGDVLPINIPDASTVEEHNALITRITAEWQTWWQERFKRMWASGEVVNSLPLVVRPILPNLAYFESVEIFVDEFVKHWERWTVPPDKLETEVQFDYWEKGLPGYGKLAVVVFDDLYGLLSLTRIKPPLNERALQVKKAFESLLVESEDGFRKKYLRPVFTAHADEEFDTIAAGFSQACSLKVRMYIDGHQKAHIIDPGKLEFDEATRTSKPVVIATLDTHFGPGVINVVGRTD